MENSVNERRLRSVFDAIDLGNNKKALQEVDKVLKKTPNLKTGLALKALALIRLSREKESQSLIQELEKNSDICDDATLQVMTYCYRELDQLDKICTIYQNAAKHQPGNEELLTQLFMAYVRIGDYKSQQTVALNLFKTKPKNPYYFWAVMSVVLQALRGPESKDKQKSKVLLTLAQRMVDKIIDSDKIEAEQEVQLYLNILEYQEKYEEMLSFLESQVCKDKFPGAPITIKIDIFKKLRKWIELKNLSKQLLEEDADRWDYYQDYLLACFELAVQDKSMIDSCFNFINDLIEKSSNKKIRGPYLARLQMHKKMRDLKLDANALLGDYQELLIDYFRLFGNKKCCTNDLKIFLDYMDSEKRIKFAAKLVQDSAITSTTLPQNKDQLQKHVCSLQISRLCGSHSSLSTEHLHALYSALSLHYEHSFSALGKNLLSTDIGPSDQYVILAAHVMYDIAIKQNSTDRLVEILHLLNYLLKNSPSNFHAKLLCLQIFHILGCTLGAHKIYDSLDIKHIQLDSMGYLHCAHLPSTGINSLSKPIYDQTLKFFTASYKDSLEYLAMSYKFGSFSKLQEFMDFRERLSNSLHYSMISVEALLQEIVQFNGSYHQNYLQFQNMKIEPNQDRIDYDILCDNRDLNVMLRWDPMFSDNQHHSFDEKVREIENENYVQDVDLLRIRSNLLRLVAASVDLIHLSNDRGFIDSIVQNGHEFVTAGESYKALIANWHENFSRIRKLNYRRSSSQFLVNLLQSRIFYMIQLPYEEIFGVLGEFVYDLWMERESCKEHAKKMQNEIVKLTKYVEKLDVRTSENEIFHYKDMQSLLVGAIEMLSLCSFVLSNCYEKCNSTLPGKKKKQYIAHENKKDNENILLMKDKNFLLNEILKEIRNSLNVAEISLVKLKPIKVEKTLNEYLASLSITPKEKIDQNTNATESHSVISSIMLDVYSIFEESYHHTARELSLLIKDKLKMINVKL